MENDVVVNTLTIDILPHEIQYYIIDLSMNYRAIIAARRLYRAYIAAIIKHEMPHIRNKILKINHCCYCLLMMRMLYQVNLGSVNAAMQKIKHNNEVKLIDHENFAIKNNNSCLRSSQYRCAGGCKLMNAPCHKLVDFIIIHQRMYNHTTREVSRVITCHDKYVRFLSEDEVYMLLQSMKRDNIHTYNIYSVSEAIPQKNVILYSKKTLLCIFGSTYDARFTISHSLKYFTLLVNAYTSYIPQGNDYVNAKYTGEAITKLYNDMLKSHRRPDEIDFLRLFIEYINRYLSDGKPIRYCAVFISIHVLAVDIGRRYQTDDEFINYIKFLGKKYGFVDVLPFDILAISNITGYITHYVLRVYNTTTAQRLFNYPFNSIHHF
jgi:hypothetical protein